jgi:peptidoglycan/xylan/chitin deacetylase (PgdA/CDA1 family)
MQLGHGSFSQKQIAITIDDPNTVDTPILSWIERDSMILNSLNQHGIRTGLFVCGMRIDNENGKKLLNNWDANNHIICNHSYSHLYYPSKEISIERFIADFRKGDSIIRSFENYYKLFRFPYLKEGNSTEKRDSMRAVLTKEAYKNGYVTIDASDWYIDSQLSAALRKDIGTDLVPYKEYYIKHILDRMNYYDSLSLLVFQREIKHTLLLHHSLLNALFLNDLLYAIKENGWELIDAKSAFQDDIFLQQPNISPCGESIIWQCAQQIESISRTLRFPAEDGAYEKEPLNLYLNEYNQRRKKNE